MEGRELIVFEVGIDGHVKMHVKGVKGTKCADLTKDFLGALGGHVVSQHRTPEYYEREEKEKVRA